MAEYFGYNDTTGLSSGQASVSWIRNGVYSWTNADFTCPGAGSRTLSELAFYCKSNGGTPGHIRVAIYDTSRNLIAEGSAELTVSSTTAGWVTHSAFVDPAGSPSTPILTGGTDYILVFAVDSTDVTIYYTAGSNGDVAYNTNDYTGGFPDTLASGTNYNRRYPIRAGVEEVGGGSVLLHAQHYYRLLKG